jgi:hypothetical protein
MRRKDVLQLTLQLNFQVVMTTCNSLYLHIVSVIGQVVWVARVAIHRIYGVVNFNSITTLFQLLCKSSITITIMSC